MRTINILLHRLDVLWWHLHDDLPEFHQYLVADHSLDGPDSAKQFLHSHDAVLCHGSRSKVNQLFLGGFIGVVVYEISAACGALMGAWGKSTGGHHENYPVIGIVSAYVVLAIVSVLYARSSPRHHFRREGGDAD